MKKFVYALRGIPRQNSRQLLLGRLLDILNAAEVLEQVGSALIAHARDFIQCGAAHLFAAQLAVILDGEPVDLLLHAADERKQRRSRRDAELTAVRRNEGTGTMTVVLDRLAQVAYEDYHQYSITWGSQNFREALAAKQTYFMGRRIDPNTEIVTTCGSTEAMMAAMMTVTNPGDKVIIFSPFYENYGADTILSGAEPIYVPLVPPDFHFDANVLEDAFRQHPKAIILCNPSNPCGKVFTREELEIIASLAEKYDTYVITDEVYEHIVFAPNKHTYFATLPGMWERTLSCSSLSKTYSVTGWRLGYIIAPPEIIDRAKKVHDFLTVGAAAPLQEAVVTGLKMGQDYYDDLQAKYTHKKDLFLKGLDDLKIAHTDPQGAYYVLLDIAEFGYESDLAFCEDLAHYVGVGAVPGSSFFREPVNNLIRLHFAKKDETLLDALNRLEGLRDKIKPKHR